MQDHVTIKEHLYVQPELAILAKYIVTLKRAIQSTIFANFLTLLLLISCMKFERNVLYTKLLR